MITGLIAGGAALAIYFWPEKKAWKLPAKKTASPSFAAAIAALSLVQQRLSDTDLLDDEQREAVDCLTLALVKGSVDE